MSCAIKYWHDEKIDAMWASWVWSPASGRVNGKICAVKPSDVTTTTPPNPILHPENHSRPFVAVALTDGRELMGLESLAQSDHIPRCVKKGPGYPLFCDAYDVLKSRLPKEDVMEDTVIKDVVKMLNDRVRRLEHKRDERISSIDSLRRMNEETRCEMREALSIKSYLKQQWHTNWEDAWDEL